MTLIFFIFQICIVCLSYSFGEEINLYGDAGEAYAIEVNIGHPHQKFKLLVDTGSTTLALASYARNDSGKYFHAENSSSLYNSGNNIQAAYTQGTWTGLLASDFIQFPSLTIPEVRSDFALITDSHDFFTKASGWQGLLGLAYMPVGAWGKSGSVESWMDALDRNVNKPMSFRLKLCGPISTTNTTHYGYFNVVDDRTPNPNTNKTFRTPVLRQRWYEVGVIAIRVMKSMAPETKEVILEDKLKEPDEDMCVELNSVKSIVDSGTTQIKLPNRLFRQVVDELKNEFRKSQVLILDEFWNRREAACWPEPQVWTLPWLAIDLLSADADNQYFTLEIPPKNYMLVVGVHNSSDTTGTVSTYCYKLGLDSGGTETVIGYTAMEGLQVTFNRSAGWIGFQTSDCGANARITVPPIQKCSLSDSSCVKKSAQNALAAIAAGIPEIGTEVLDPVHIDVIKIDLSGLKLTIRDADIKGLKNAVVDKLKIDTAKKIIEFSYHAAPLTLKGKYKASGMLLILPINGDGDVTLKIKNLEVAMKMPYEIIKNENGKDVIDLKSYTYTYENNENTHFKLTNLFNGNKQLSDAMHTFMNGNWKAISQEFGDPMLVKPLQKIYTVIKTYLRSRPLEEIANV